MLINRRQKLKLERNGRESTAALDAGKAPPDHQPVIRLAAGWAGCSWLVTEMHEGDRLYGLADFNGTLELGSISLKELRRVRPRIVRDRRFRAKGTLSQYTIRARDAGKILIH